uniref:Uncharacterized protein n=1 Tax=Glossina morsitans morsitans TaxID=37546 RepID=A0A1B0FH53_GLOMM
MAAEIKPAQRNNNRFNTRKPELLSKLEESGDDISAAISITGENGVISVSDDNFPHPPFHINSSQYWNNPSHSWCRAFLSMMDMSDIQEDVSEHLGVMRNFISRRFQGRTNYQPLPRRPRRSSSESEYLINKRHDGEVVRANLLVVPAHDLPDTGNRYEYHTHNAKTLSQANRYGATENLVLPVCEAEITKASPPHFHLAGAPA